ncbi:MAG: GNAT family N-acetyltransferase [Dehalococcoidales bacterium]
MENRNSKKPAKQISIITTRLSLQHLTLKNAPDLFAYRSKPEVYLYQSWQPKTIQDAQVFIKSTADRPGIVNTWYQLGIFRKDNEELIGDLGIHFIVPEGRQIELGYTLKPEQQGRGYATEAVNSLIDYLFGKMGTHRISCSLDSRNTRSKLLVERLGFRQEAHFKQSFFQAENWQDELVFSVLAREWHHNPTRSN